MKNNPIQMAQRKELKWETNVYSFTFNTAGLQTKQHHHLASYFIDHADLRTSSRVTQRDQEHHDHLFRVKTKLWAVFLFTGTFKKIFNTVHTHIKEDKMVGGRAENNVI